MGYLKKNQSAPRPSEHPPVMGEKMSKRLGRIIYCIYLYTSGGTRLVDMDLSPIQPHQIPESAEGLWASVFGNQLHEDRDRGHMGVCGL